MSAHRDPMKFSALLRSVTPHRKTLVAIVFLLLAESLFSLAGPWLAGELTAKVLGERGSILDSVNLILLLWLALMLAKSILNFSSQYLVGKTGQDMAARLRTSIYRHMQLLQLGYLQERSQGEMLTILSNDSEHISNFVTTTLVQLLPLLATFFGAFLIMAWLDPVIACLAVLLLPVYYLATKVIGRRIRPLTAAWIKSWSNMVALAQENLGLMPAIKAFVRENLESERFEDKNRIFLGWSNQQILIQSVLSPAVTLLAGAGLLLLLWVGLGHIASGKLETSSLVSLMLYAAMLTRPISGLANVYGNVMLTRGAAERLLEFFATQTEDIETGRTLPRDVEGQIEFRDISFSYPDRAPVFSAFNLQIDARETVALTGPNGAGKSTLVHLLCRFIEPSAGTILIDGQDIRQFSLASLRDHIGLVAQNTLLLNGTIAENIAYGRPDASLEEIKAAAHSAGASTFIESLANDYSTLIGDQGVRLSGGQRQRLSLARTLIKNPPILVLDEATAMFDPEGEDNFIDECRDLLKQRTVILITHRPASLALADRILKLVPGQNLAEVTDDPLPGAAGKPARFICKVAAKSS
jgi:ATP-binding cassette subfamily B protein